MQSTSVVTSDSKAQSKVAVAETGVYVPVTVVGLATVSCVQDFLKTLPPPIIVLLKSEEAFQNAACLLVNA